jgi:hypothetical protein
MQDSPCTDFYLRVKHTAFGTSGLIDCEMSVGDKLGGDVVKYLTKVLGGLNHTYGKGGFTLATAADKLVNEWPGAGKLDKADTQQIFANLQTVAIPCNQSFFRFKFSNKGATTAK